MPMGSISLAVEAESLISLNFSLSIVGFMAKSLTAATHDLPHHKSISGLQDSSHCTVAPRPPSPSAGPSGGALAVPNIPGFSIKWQHLNKPRDKEWDLMACVHGHGCGCFPG